MLRDKLISRQAFWILAILFISSGKLSAQYTVDFSYQNGNQCGYAIVDFTFTNSGGGNVTGLKWHFGDGTTVNQGMVDGQMGESLDLQASRLYNAAGSFSTRVDVYLDNSATETTTVNPPQSVVIFPLSVVDILKVNTSGTCAPVTVTFEPDVKTGNITEFFWVFGDGYTVSAASDEQVAHTYSTPGSYPVSLRVTDANGCRQTFLLDEEVQVGKGFNLRLQSSGRRKTCEVPHTISFRAEHDPGSYSYLWDFGDGGTSTLKEPQHTYQAVGNYNVSVTVRNLDDNCESTVTRNEYIKIEELVPDFRTNEPVTGCAPLLVSFENTSNIIENRQQVTWDFGDGNTVSGSARDAEIRNPEHTYTSQGTFNVTMTVEDPQRDCSGQMVKNALVTIPDTLNPDFTADKHLFCEDTDMTVNFQGDAPGASTWLWDFGDGATSTEQNPSHTYAGFGSYTVTLTVTNAFGCSFEERKAGFVVAGPTVADFGAFATGGCYPEFTSVLFDSSASVVPITGWEWTITHRESGTVAGTSTEQHPQLTLTEPGGYDVSLRVTTALGCEDELLREEFLTIGYRPDIFDFTPSETLICNGTNVNFQNHSEMPDNPYTTNWYWDYLNIGEIMGTGYNGSYTYDDSDPNPVTVVLISENNGCLDTLVKEDILKIELPKADFEYFREPCVLDSIYLVDASMGAQEFIWDISVEGETPYTDDQNRNPVVFVPPGKTWEATLTAINNDARNGAGCTHSFTLGGTQPDNGMPDFSGVTITNSSSGICFPATFELDASSVTVPGTTITSYFWELGNNSLASGMTTAAVYDEPGFYTVRLVITTAEGCKFEHIMPDAIKVYGPVVNFEVCNAGTCVGSDVLFRDFTHSIAEVTRRTWEVDGEEVHATTDPNEDFYIYAFDSARNQPAQDGHYVVTLTVEDAMGCVGTSSIKVRPTHPIPDFTLEKEPVCGGDMYSFRELEVLSEGLKPLSAYWTFSNESTYNGNEPEDIFFEGSAEGTPHFATVYLYDLNGCVDSLKKEFTVYTDSIKVNFTAKETLATCPPFTVEFEDLSSLIDPLDMVENELVNWIWDFGDGGVLTNVQHPSYTYTKPGSFDVKLIVEDALGCQDSLIFEDFITLQGPDGTFEVSDTLGYQPFEVEFEAFPIPETADYQYIWDFGNGQFGSGQNISYTYNNPGVFYAGLILVDGECSYPLPEKQRIEVLPCPQLADISEEFCVFGDEITLSVWDESHAVSLGEVAYEWVYRESGQVVSTESHYTLNQPQGLTEDLVAIFDVTMTVTEGGGDVCSQAVEVSVTFKPSPSADFELLEAICEPVGGEYQLDFQSTSMANGTGATIDETHWDFNEDGLFDEGTGEVVSYSFDSNGSKQVSVAVLQSNGCADTVTQTIYIPRADFAVTEGCQEEDVNFGNLSEVNPGEAVTYLWDFGDGNTSDGENPTHAYETAGSYNIQLTVIGETCQITSEVKTLNIHPKPEAVLTISEACLGRETVFEIAAEIVTGSVDTVKWDFDNDGVTDLMTTGLNAAFMYPSLGAKTVKAVLITDKGCERVIQQDFGVNPVPVPDFTFQDVCAEETVVLEDQSTIDDSEISTALTMFEFDFDGDGTYEASFEPGEKMEHAYDLPGQYRVGYRVTSDKGCSDTLSRIISISPIPEANFTSQDVCDGEFMEFLDRSNAGEKAIINYEWDFESDGVIDANGTSAIHKYESPGEYEVTLTVTNTSGCLDQLVKTVEVFPLPVIEAGNDVTICEGDVWELQASSASDITLWSWENGASEQALYAVSPQATTAYYVEGTDINGCVSWDSVVVTVINQPDLVEDTVACDGDVLTFDATIAGDYFATYQWSTGETSPIINVVDGGEYEVTVNVSGFDDTGKECLFTHSIGVTYNPLPDPLTADSLIFCFEDLYGTGRPDTLIQYESDYSLIVWGDDPDFTNTLSQTNELLVTDAVEYFVSVTNQYDCSRTDSIKIVELCPTRIMFPTAFTPNSDGLNDGFRVKGDNFLNYELTIFNRWGEVLFNTENQDAAWPGTYKGTLLPGGVYPFVVTFEEELSPGKKVTQYGSVTLIR